ncbi:unnamed protein product [Protopolystoma xenopodis]|uniref:Uncharacterized protein n=1 Tax=Protopolystoma xenopodis TaxID=117903 RepID=A0A3S5A1J2_9PLAT|nr:unnamed protein product [Protopolystoma xenopodis]
MVSTTAASTTFTHSTSTAAFTKEPGATANASSMLAGPDAVPVLSGPVPSPIGSGQAELEVGSPAQHQPDSTTQGIPFTSSSRRPGSHSRSPSPIPSSGFVSTSGRGLAALTPPSCDALVPGPASSVNQPTRWGRGSTLRPLAAPRGRFQRNSPADQEPPSPAVPGLRHGESIDELWLPCNLGDV